VAFVSPSSGYVLSWRGTLASDVGANANVCVAVKGVVRVQKGLTACEADDTSRALAIEQDSEAYAWGNSVARATGAESAASMDDTSTAVATDGGDAASSVSGPGVASVWRAAGMLASITPGPPARTRATTARASEATSRERALRERIDERGNRCCSQEPAVSEQIREPIPNPTPLRAPGRHMLPVCVFAPSYPEVSMRHRFAPTSR
jgi:hypothetical protein